MENDKKYFLGHRAFSIFLLRQLKSALILPIFAFFLWYSERWIPFVYQPWIDYAARAVFLVGAAYLLFVIIRTRLEYRCYTYTFTDEAFIMTNGFIVRNEFAALYHQIHNVNIRRTVADRMIGVSQLVILMAGLNREGQHAQLILPGVGKKRAKMLQKELLIRAREHFTSPPPENEEDL